MTPDKFTVVGTFGSVAEAEMARGQLAAAGLEVRLDNAQTLGVLPMHSLAIGGVGVAVVTRYAAQARAILGFEEDGRPEEETEPDSAVALQAPDAWMRRAAVTAVIGSAFILPALYSMYLLAKYGRGFMSPLGKRNRAIAIVFNAFSLVVVTLFALLSC